MYFLQDAPQGPTPHFLPPLWGPAHPGALRGPGGRGPPPRARPRPSRSPQIEIISGSRPSRRTPLRGGSDTGLCKCSVTPFSKRRFYPLFGIFIKKKPNQTEGAGDFHVPNQPVPLTHPAARHPAPMPKLGGGKRHAPGGLRRVPDPPHPGLAPAIPLAGSQPSSDAGTTGSRDGEGSLVASPPTPRRRCRSAMGLLRGRRHRALSSGVPFGGEILRDSLHDGAGERSGGGPSPPSRASGGFQPFICFISVII